MRTETKNFTVSMDEDEPGRGWFEHHKYGDEYGGGLWYDIYSEVLIDYDGVFELPMEVISALRHEFKIHVPLEFEPEVSE